MNSKAKQTKDSRIEEILDLIMQLASGNLEARGTPSGLSDEIDAIIIGLNMLAEEFSTQHIALTEAEQRLDEILDVIMGNLAGIVGITRDMREIRELISQLEDKTRSLERANKELKESTVQLIQSEKLSALGELTAGVAHELNQPLNAIKIICQSILRDIEKNRFEEETLEQDLNDVVNQVNKMAEIIDHMRIFTRRTEGIPKEMIDVNSVIEGALKFVGQQLKNRNIEVVRELSPDLPKVIGDAIRLEQVVMNLITNARNAVEISGKEHKSIEIRTYSENRNQIDNQLSAIDNPAVVVEVTDNGVGIPEDLREKIFQPFFTTREPGKGTGLGLSVASKIVEEHNGRIEVESQIGEGTTFRVLLPMHV
jgi:C4-dicarboxylate-specific signal transduction histidine kinase